MPDGITPRGAVAADTTLVKALARAFRWRRMMEAGRFATINELAAAEKINSSYVSRLLWLSKRRSGDRGGIVLTVGAG